MLSDVAAERIKWWRDRRGLTRERLAERCEELGWPALTHGVLGTIETGRRDENGKRRREITVDELVVLAHALGVPPVLLLAPLGYVDSIEVLPGAEMDTLSAYEYMVGGTVAANTMTPDEHRAMVKRAEVVAPEGADPKDYPPGEPPKFVVLAAPDLVVRTYRDYHAAVLRWMFADLERGKLDEAGQIIESPEKVKRIARAQVQMLERTMREAGWRLPPLPGGNPDETGEES